MVYVKWGFRAVFWGLVLAFLHYTLPQHDIVRITDTYEKRVKSGTRMRCSGRTPRPARTSPRPSATCSSSRPSAPMTSR